MCTYLWDTHHMSFPKSEGMIQLAQLQGHSQTQIKSCKIKAPVLALPLARCMHDHRQVICLILPTDT